MKTRLPTIAIGLAASLACGASVLAQQPAQAPGPAAPGPAAPAPAPSPAAPPAGTPSPAQTTPLPTTTAPGPGPGTNQAPTPPAPEKALPPATPVPPAAGRVPLVANPGDPSDVDEVTLPAKPAAILSGTAKWDQAVPSLKDAIAKVEAALAQAGIKAVGKPLSVFTRTDDDGFQYEVMVPVEAAPNPRPAGLPDDLRFGATPSGKALRFTHKGPYEGIDQTYETVTAYLDAKGIIVQDAFVEEYLTPLASPSDDALEVNIYALPK
ncbi:AraC family transcriptional regulator [Methylobacterium terrae]|uniref:AraC family transcriptional regulator n=1 Tax=Methylobacterium terrae TaxID=2202827 RepID=A0A2U8WR05_9HYPH|nr:GyrI-like domain-containing protein [Methylobacterium terrae]AWN47931.1 AraC family transcriptional regulator [Methylobacterium terrae]